MPKYTRQHYIAISNTIKKLPRKEREREYRKWNRIFKADNPRYNSKMFKEFVGL
jgi:hypothetical protein